MKRFHQFLDRPGWRTYLLLPVLYFAAIQISFFCGKTPENEVIIWLPNSVLLAALLRFRGQGGLRMAALTFAINVAGNMPTASLSEAVLLSLVNLAEVTLTYLLMQYAGASSRLTRVEDFAKFVMAGPVLSAFFSGLLGAAVITAYGASTPYFTLMRVWWFDDGLGLLIFTPLLMLATQSRDEAIPWQLSDFMLLLFTLGLVTLMFLAHRDSLAALPLTPTLLIPAMLVLAMRRSVFFSALGVALISLAISRIAAVGIRPFGEADMHQTIMHTQEFILTFSLICMGAAILRNQLRVNEHELEQKVRDRTTELSSSLLLLKNAQTELVQSEKLAALGALVAGVSHELNSPIGIAVTVASSLQDRMKAMKANLTAEKLRRSEFNLFFEEGIEMTALLQRSVHRASDLLSSFKMVAVDRASERRRVFKLIELLNDIEGIWRLGHEFNPFKIIIDIAPDIECNSYPGPLGQIVSNLLQNAALHAFDGRANESSQGTLRISAVAIENELTIQFADDGKGMDATTLARIFDPFFTTRLGQGGSGLGLSICRNIANGVLAGTLSAVSEVGRGTIFTLTFPRHAPA